MFVVLALFVVPPTLISVCVANPTAPPRIPCKNPSNSPSIANDVPCADDLERYQIVLWFSIVIAFVAVAAVYQLAFMSFRKDTMLYSSFNPNWEGKRR
jgi:hypothetical protein